MERDFRDHASRGARLRCGILAHGFARVRCTDCGHDRLLAFSCKGRGVCPSCNARRMAEVAAHLTDEVIPHLPVRQWVLSVPKRLRPFLHQTPEVASGVLTLFLRALRSALRDASPGAPAAVRGAQLGAISFPQRLEGSLPSTHRSGSRARTERVSSGSFATVRGDLSPSSGSTPPPVSGPSPRRRLAWSNGSTSPMGTVAKCFASPPSSSSTAWPASYHPHASTAIATTESWLPTRA